LTSRKSLKEQVKQVEFQHRDAEVDNWGPFFFSLDNIRFDYRGIYVNRFIRLKCGHVSVISRRVSNRFQPIFEISEVMESHVSCPFNSQVSVWASIFAMIYISIEFLLFIIPSYQDSLWLVV